MSNGLAEVVVGVVGGRSRSVEKSKSRTFPPRLEIPQERRDSHFSHRLGGDGEFEKDDERDCVTHAALLDFLHGGKFFFRRLWCWRVDPDRCGLGWMLWPGVGEAFGVTNIGFVEHILSLLDDL